MIPTLVDSHCHLNFQDFQEDVDQVVRSAHERSIHTLLSICTKRDEIEDILQISETYPHVFASVGIHPHEAHLEAQDLMSLKKWIKERASHPKVIGLGETGLDFYYEHSPRTEQLSVFQTHIETAIDLQLPLIIHTRDAEKETLQLLKYFPKAKGVIHCFSGSPALAEEALALGYYISVSGIITFKKSEDLREVIKKVPLERLLLETDAPFLAPVPHRGKRNEPALMVHTAHQVAELKNISLEELAGATTRNFFTLFSKACHV